LITFFELISFFGVAALFSWLAFAPLQRDQLQAFKHDAHKLAEDHFSTLNDHFFASFVFFSLSWLGLSVS